MNHDKAVQEVVAGGVEMKGGLVEVAGLKGFAPDGLTVGVAKALITTIETLAEALRHLAICEPHINNWDYPAGMADEVNDLLDAYYGVGVRPAAEPIKKPNPIP